MKQKKRVSDIDYDMPLEKALGVLNPQEMIKYVMGANLDSMSQTYEDRLGDETEKIIIERQLDPSDALQRKVGAEWYNNRKDRGK